MSYNKLNVFHWHITDTHSFPLHLKSVPELARYGAYSPEKTYSAKDVAELLTQLDGGARGLGELGAEQQQPGQTRSRSASPGNVMVVPAPQEQRLSSG